MLEYSCNAKGSTSTDDKANRHRGANTRSGGWGEDALPGAHLKGSVPCVSSMHLQGFWEVQSSSDFPNKETGAQSTK